MEKEAVKSEKAGQARIQWGEPEIGSEKRAPVNISWTRGSAKKKKSKK